MKIKINIRAAASTNLGTTVGHTSAGVTYYFAEPVEYGYYWNGDPFVVSNGKEITVVHITPISDTDIYTIDDNGDTGLRTLHGAMLQPRAFQGNAFDGGGKGAVMSYEPALNMDPTATGSPLTISFAEYPDGASLVKAVSLEDLSQRQAFSRSFIEKFSVLTVVPSVPPENAFRPPVAGTDKTSYYTLSDLDFSKLQNVPIVDGQKPISEYDHLAEATTVSWWKTNWDIVDIHPNSYHVGYNDYQLDYLTGAFMAIHSDYRQEEKLNTYAGIVQHGIDYAGNALAGNIFPSDGGHGNLYKPFVVTAAVALNSPNLKAISSQDGVFAEDEQFIYVGSDLIDREIYTWIDTQEPRLGREYQDVQIGMPEWINTPTSLNPAVIAEYRWHNSDNVPIIALTMEMLGNGEGREVWANEAYFDYAERIRLIQSVNPAPAGTRHQDEVEWRNFIGDYHASYSLGPNVTLRPEQPSEISIFSNGTDLNVTVGGSVYSGSAPVTQIDVRYKGSSDPDWTVLQNFGMDGQISDLTLGEVYFVQARYVNSVGEGPWSDNGFMEKNFEIRDRLFADGILTQSQMDTWTGYRKSEEYKDHLRSILAGDEGYKALADDLLNATVTLL